MAVISDQIHGELRGILQTLQSSDNVARTAAEEKLNTEWVTAQPDMLLMALVEVAAGVHQEEVSQRAHAAVIFRRIALRIPQGSKVEVFWSLERPQKHAIREKLLQTLAAEKEKSSKHKLGDAVAEIARQYSSRDEIWSELLGALFEASQSEDPAQRETAYRIFNTTPDIIGKEHEDAVLAALSKGFRDDNIDVRLAALGAFSSFFERLSKKAQTKYFPLIGDILSILPAVKNPNEEEKLKDALVAMTELALLAPRMFKSHFSDLVSFCVSVVQDKEFDDQTRQSTMELMVSFAEANPTMCKKDASFVNEMVTQCLSLMTDVGTDDDDAAEWKDLDDKVEEDSQGNHIYAEGAMDRMAQRLGGQVILPPTFNWLPRMINSSSWRDKHAALMTISAISEGCAELMMSELDKVLELVLPSLQDPHPRVRWAALNAIGQMSTDFKVTMQKGYHHVILPALIPMLKAPEARVKSHAAAALVNFCEETEEGTIAIYLDDLLNNLVPLLEEPKYVVEQALSTLATVADASHELFSRYYDTMMPMLFNLLRGEQDKEYRMLRAKAMECATLIALAVKKERMGQDALDLMQILGSIQRNIVDADDPQAQYLTQCWGRMCNCLGDDFVPYLPEVLPPIIEVAGAKADILLIDDEEQASRYADSQDWEVMSLKGRSVCLKTSSLEDKRTNIEVLTGMITQLGVYFEPWVVQITDEVAIPALEFFFHAQSQNEGALLMPLLIDTYRKAHGAQSPQMIELWERTVPRLIGVLGAEPSIDLLTILYVAFYECVESLGPNCLSNEHMATFCKHSRAVLQDYQKRVREREGLHNDDEDEDEDTLMEIEDDATLLSEMNKAFHAVMKSNALGFLPHWAKLIPTYNNFIKSRDSQDRQWAICVYDDLLEFAGQKSWDYNEHIIPAIAGGMRDEVPDVLQAACYGAGVAAQKGGEAWSEFSAASLPLLFEVTNHQNARDDDHIYATENACASIAKILHFNSGKVDNVQEVVRLWVDTLPVTNDEEAAPYAYSFLATLIDQQNPAVTAPNQPAKIFTYVAQALGANTLQGNTANNVVEATKRLVNASGGVDANQLLQGLEPETQDTVRKYFS